MNNLLTQKFPIAAFVLLFVLTLSCSHDPHDENQDPSNTDVHEWEDSTLSGDAVMGSAMTFKVGGGMSVERTAQTRVTTDIDGIATFTEGDLVAVAVTRSGGSEVIKLYQVKSDGSLEYAGGDNDPFVWKSTGETVSLRAWSYGTSTNLSYTLTAPETRDYTLETDQQTNGYRELLYCKAADKSYSGGTISLNFYHQLSRLVVNVSHDLTGTLPITSVSVGSNTFPTTARFTVPEGNSNVGSWTPSAYGTIVPKTETAQSGYQATYSAVVFPKTYTKDSKIFTLTNSDGNYTFAITESEGQALIAGNQYNYAINVRDDIRKNPLWWVAQYNLAQNKTSFVTAHSTTNQYVFKFTDVQMTGVSYYHVPTRNEMASVIPSNVVVGPGTSVNIFSLTNNLSNPYEFSEAACNVNGLIIPASTSIIGNNSSMDYYAIRFINTPYCSAWHYKWITPPNSPCNGFLIESYLLSGVTTLAQAKAKMAETGFTTTTFTNSANSAKANQSPSSTAVTTKCFVQRFFPGCGDRISSTESGIVNEGAGEYCGYWTSSTYCPNNYGYFLRLYVAQNSLNLYGISLGNIGFSVRPFYDGCSGTVLASSAVGNIVCSHGKAHAATTGSLSCGGQKVAIVAYKGNGEDKSYYNNGLAIAMQDANNGAYCRWFTEASGSCVTQTQDEELSDVMANYQGIYNTNILANATCISGHNHAAAKAAQNYNVMTPPSCSQWFLPTMGQWNLIVKAMTGVLTGLIKADNEYYQAPNFNIKIKAAGGTGVQGTGYWSSIEKNDQDTWAVGFGHGTAGSYNKNRTDFCARSALAF